MITPSGTKKAEGMAGMAFGIFLRWMLDVTHTHTHTVLVDTCSKKLLDFGIGGFHSFGTAGAFARSSSSSRTLGEICSEVRDVSRLFL